jgi:signal transduction histidine kinase
LTIRLTEGPKGVEIQVEDDGPGIDPQQVGKGVGLSNLILRLEQLYAGEATFQAEQLNPGTRITLRFPPPPKLTARSRNPAGDPSEHGR